MRRPCLRVWVTRTTCTHNWHTNDLTGTRKGNTAQSSSLADRSSVRGCQQRSSTHFARQSLLLALDLLSLLFFLSLAPLPSLCLAAAVHVAAAWSLCGAAAAAAQLLAGDQAADLPYL